MTAASSTGGGEADAAARHSTTGSAFLELSPSVAVVPREIAAVTQHPDFPAESRVYIRGAGTTFLRVDRPMAEVAALLDEARTSPPGSP